MLKFSCNAGVPSFTKVAESPSLNAGIIGTGHGTTSSLNGQPGTGLFWASDVERGNLRIYKAVPENGLLVEIKRFNIDSVTKFNRPVFGNGRAYMGTTNGYIYGFGSPINLPLECTGNVVFDALELGVTSEAKTITCVAKIALTVSAVSPPTSGNNFVISGLPSTPLQLTLGASFSFKVAFKPALVGPVSSDVLVTINSIAGYSADTPVTLRGTGQSASPLLQVSPVQLAFGGAVTGENPDGMEQSLILSNLGNQPLKIESIVYSFTSSEGVLTTVAVAPNVKIGPFTLINVPSTIAAQSTATLRVNFDTSMSGDFAIWVQLVSNGGKKDFQIIGSAGDPPIGLIEFQTESGWVKYDPAKKFSIGDVYQGNTKSLRMRVTNTAVKSGVPLTISVSKPPFGFDGLINAANQKDLAEGVSLLAGESASAVLYCSVPKSQWNVDPINGYAAWTMNLNDMAGKRFIEFDCNGVAEQSVPLQSSGNRQGRYRYIGCYVVQESGRQQYYGSADNTIAMCTEECGKRGSVFCGTQYHRECWGRTTLPAERAEEINCNFDCSGSLTQTCGGNGEGWGSGRSYISLFADIERYNSNGTVPIPGPTTTSSAPIPPIPTGGPVVNPGVNGYASIGCYTEATTGRALPNGFTMPAGSKHVATCVAGCASKNYLYAGLEYGMSNKVNLL